MQPCSKWLHISCEIKGGGQEIAVMYYSHFLAAFFDFTGFFSLAILNKLFLQLFSF